MNCFCHPEKAAVGLCKCGRALCPECAADTGQSLACKGRHEERARMMDQMIDRNKQIMDRHQRVLNVSNKQLSQNAIFSVAAGLVFLIAGIAALWSSYSTNLGIFFSVMGALFLIRGVAGYRRSARYPALEKEESK